MTLHEMILIALSLGYGGMALAYVQERLRQKHENALFDLLTFPCIVLWALPFLVFWLGRRLIEAAPVPGSRRPAWIRGWGMAHALLVLGGWAFYMVRIRAPGTHLLAGFMLLAVLLPLEVFLAVPAKFWSWDPDA